MLLFSPISDSRFGDVPYHRLPDPFLRLLDPVLLYLEERGVTGVTQLSLNIKDPSTIANVFGRHMRFDRILPDDADDRERYELVLRALVLHVDGGFVSSSPGKIGAAQHCVVCGTSHPSGVYSCANPACESHDLRQLIDPSYQRPDPSESPWSVLERIRVVRARADTPANSIQGRILVNGDGEKP